MDGFDNFEVELYGVPEVRRDLKRIKEYFQSLEYYEWGIRKWLMEVRQMPESVIKDTDAFVVDEPTAPEDLPDWMQNMSLGFVRYGRVTMEGRCVFPVKSVSGEIIGFVGWDPTVKPKYLDSVNVGYKAKQTTFYGMENLPEYYTNDKPVFITEGLMCTVWLRSQGFQAMASLGSHLTQYQVQILRRFGNRLVMIPDNDDAGEGYIRQIKYLLPKSLCCVVMDGKDVDGCRREHQEDLIHDLNNVLNPCAQFKIMCRR